MTPRHGRLARRRLVWAQRADSSGRRQVPCGALAVPSVAIAALSAVALVAGAPAATASCIPSVRYGGATYDPARGTFDRDQIAFGALVGRGAIPGCSAIMLPGPPPPPPPDQHASVLSVRGVSPKLAVGVARPSGGGPMLYLRPGFLVTVPAHPLHQAYFGRADLPDLRTGRHCRRHVRLDGRVLGVRDTAVLLRVSGAGPRGASLVGQTVVLNTDAATVLRVQRWAGLPFIRVGAHLGARACHAPGPPRGVIAESLFEATPT